jgi:hypothetical protein
MVLISPEIALQLHASRAAELRDLARRSSLVRQFMRDRRNPDQKSDTRQLSRRRARSTRRRTPSFR